MCLWRIRQLPIAMWIVVGLVGTAGVAGCSSSNKTPTSVGSQTGSPTTEGTVAPSTQATTTTIAPTPTSASPGPGGVVPNITGKALDQAEGTLLSDGIGYKVYGGGTFGVVVPSHWTVCSQTPAAGVTATAVNLVVARTCS